MTTLPPTPRWKALVGNVPIRALISPHTSPNGLRISGERGGEADERVRCMRVLGGPTIIATVRAGTLLPDSRKLEESILRY